MPLSLPDIAQFAFKVGQPPWLQPTPSRVEYECERCTPECATSLSFPKAGNGTEMVGQTPWSARVPLDPLVASE
jgi:hypothetical protein